MAEQSNYVLGRGKIYFDTFAPGTTNLTGERFIGNAPEFNLTVETESLEHFKSTEGLRIRDRNVTTQVTYSGAVTADDIQRENLAAFFLGETSTRSVSSDTGVTETFNGVKTGRTYQIGRDASNIAGLRDVTVQTVEQSGGGTSHSAGTDYEVDSTTGRITILEGGGISDGDDIDVTYDVAAYSIYETISKANVVEGAVRFISANGIGEQMDYFIPRTLIRPNGDFSLIGEEWQQVGFSLDIGKLNDSTPEVLVNGRPFTP